MFTIEYYKPKEIPQLQQSWQTLERGEDMTYFQTFDWYAMLAEVGLVQEEWIETIVAVIIKDNTPVLIAPLIIVKRTYHFVNKKGVYFWGRKGWSDYLNMIYNQFNSDAVDYLILSIKEKYGLKRFFFEQVRAKTAFYQYLKNDVPSVVANDTTCVALNLPESVDDYLKMLSKHSRQNLRTAQNRLDKDGIKLRISFDDAEVDKMLCKKMRERRVEEKQRVYYNHLSLLWKILYRVKCFLEYKYPSYLPFCSDEHSKMLTVYDGDTLCSFFNYGIDRYHKTIVLMAVGTNEQYARYSPGIQALYSFIRSKIEEKDIECFDFTRGDEPYKFALGGSNSLIYNVEYNT